MKQLHAHASKSATRGKGLYEFTREIEGWVAAHQAETGLLTVVLSSTLRPRW